MSVTIQEVAEAAGVSKATVSKVLHSTLYAHAASVCRRGLRAASTKGRGLM